MKEERYNRVFVCGMLSHKWYLQSTTEGVLLFTGVTGALFIFGTITRIARAWRKENSQASIWSYLFSHFLGFLPLILRGELWSNERMWFSFLKRGMGLCFLFLTILIWDRLARDVKCLPGAKKKNSAFSLCVKLISNDLMFSKWQFLKFTFDEVLQGFKEQL